MSVGKQHGVTGSDVALSLQPASIERHWGAASKMLNASDKLLTDSLQGLTPLSIIKHQGYEWCAEQHREFVGLRERYESTIDASRVDETTVIKMIGVMAETFQVTVPPKEGLKLYAIALAGLPRPVFDAAWQSVLRSHTYKTLPLPGEFIKATEDAERQLQSVRNTINHSLRKLELAMQFGRGI